MENLIGLRVKIYKNLNNGKLSIKAKIDGKERVVGYCDSIHLSNCDYKVQEGGRLTVIKTKQKNVHAWVIGTVVSIDCLCNFTPCGSFTYDPYTTPLFIDRNTKNDLIYSDHAWLSCNGGHLYA